MRVVIITLILSIFLVSCSGTVATYKQDVLYKDGTVAKYVIFIEGNYSGIATYTFNNVEYEGNQALKISSISDYNYVKIETAQDVKIKATTETIVNRDDWKPLYSKYRLEFSGTEAGYHETESKYGQMMVRWATKSPNGAYAQEVKFREEYYDEDEVLWYAPTLGYEKDYQKSFTFFANRSAQPTSGLIWMGDMHDTIARGKTYTTWAAGIRCNDIVERVWYDSDTGRLIKYEQDMGFVAYPAMDSKEEAQGDPPTTLFTMVLDSWETP